MFLSHTCSCCELSLFASTLHAVNLDSLCQTLSLVSNLNEGVREEVLQLQARLEDAETRKQALKSQNSSSAPHESEDKDSPEFHLQEELTNVDNRSLIVTLINLFFRKN